MTQLTLHRATLDDLELLDNLMQLYIHDMSEYFDVPLGANGRYTYDALPEHLRGDDARCAFLIRADGELAGFALITRGSPATTDPTDLDMREFFILRSQRRYGRGRQAAAALWKLLPGSWVVRVSENNRPALAFWEATVGEFTHHRYTTGTMQGKSSLFKVFTFR